jgi:hypothetical protein
VLGSGLMLSQVVYDRALIESACGAEAALYAERKHRGGRSGKQGASFEASYATYRIALAGCLACRGTSQDDVWFQGQTGGFIDDLAIVTVETTAFTQAKSGAASWTGGDHPLADDFRMQRQLDAAAGRRANYELVVSSDDHAAAMLKSRPDDLDDVVVTTFRCIGDNWLNLFTAHPELEEALDAISVRRPQRIVREQTFQAILGWWLHHGCRGSLRDMMLELAERPDALVRVPGPDYELPTDVVAALQGVASLSWSISGRHFAYAVGNLRGWAAFLCGSRPFSRFEQFIREQRPTEWKRVIEELRTEPDDAG